MKALTALTALLLAQSALAQSAPSTFKINNKGDISWQQKINCQSIDKCITDYNNYRQQGFKVNMNISARSKYNKVKHKQPCDTACMNDPISFITDHSL